MIIDASHATRVLDAEALRLGVVDALLFRRVGSTTWAHLGGLGRGRGWAGIVDLEETVEPLLAQLPSDAGAVLRLDTDAPRHIVGPYFTAHGAVVRISDDVVAVFGNPDTAFLGAATDDELAGLARLLDDTIEDVAPSKRLGDELEVLHAVRSVITSAETTIQGTLEHIARIAVEALSCELGAIRDGAGRVVSVSRGADAVPAERLRDALDELQARADGSTLCYQDAAEMSGLAPFSHVNGVRSLLAVPIPPPLGGVLVAVHTSVAPRGFTDLCQRLGEQLADTASVVAHTAALREDLRVVADEQSRVARTDALTGLGNRLRWDEALVDAQDAIDNGASVTVITLDVDGLKELNDTFGHDAGDDLLRSCAAILREHCRSDDVVARLGGDEFAMLLPVSYELAAERVDALTRHLTPSVHLSLRDRIARCHAVSASVGASTTTPGERVADAVREADAAMYAQKRLRRTALPQRVSV